MKIELIIIITKTLILLECTTPKMGAEDRTYQNLKKIGYMFFKRSIFIMNQTITRHYYYYTSISFETNV